jgi:hypothetical protein
MPAIPSMEQVPIGAVSWAQNICCSDTNAPLPGSNSFTKGQAKSRFEANGAVSELRKNDNGVCQGRATHGGQAA